MNAVRGAHDTASTAAMRVIGMIFPRHHRTSDSSASQSRFPMLGLENARPLDLRCVPPAGPLRRPALFAARPRSPSSPPPLAPPPLGPALRCARRSALVGGVCLARGGWLPCVLVLARWRPRLHPTDTVGGGTHPNKTLQTPTPTTTNPNSRVRGGPQRRDTNPRPNPTFRRNAKEEDPTKNEQ